MLEYISSPLIHDVHNRGRRGLGRWKLAVAVHRIKKARSLYILMSHHANVAQLVDFTASVQVQTGSVPFLVPREHSLPVLKLQLSEPEPQHAFHARL